ncbi:MAG: putative DNA-binding domain-containing protein [Candidatus Binataceae bacterium]
MNLPLKHIQSLLHRLITAPSGVAEGLAAEPSLPLGGLESVIRGDDRLSAEDRVGIYANMYFYRLLEILQEDFAATAALLGETKFHNLITGYLIEYPPIEPSVIWAGRYLSDFLRDHPLRNEYPFVADLAALERATIDVFRAADTTPLDASAMSAIPPERWAALKMRTVPATVILHAEWKVAEVLRAVEEKRDWGVPGRSGNRILVSRHNSRISYRELDEIEADALEMLGRGAAFGKVCEVLARDVSAESAPQEINSRLARWIGDGNLMLVPAKRRK